MCHSLIATGLGYSESVIGHGHNPYKQAYLVLNSIERVENKPESFVK